jgi:hypothetical protein
MKSFIRGLGLALLSFCWLGLTGCSENNESIVDQQAKKTAGAKVENFAPPPRDQREFGERQKGGTQNKASHYPGAKQ